MKKIDFGQLIAVIANVGVLTGIIFVAYEIRQSNRIAIGTTSYELNRNWMDINDLYLSNPELVTLLLAMTDEDYVPEDERQAINTRNLAARLANNWLAIEEAHDNGLASDDFYSLAEDDVRFAFDTYPGLFPTYELLFSQYGLSNFEIFDSIQAALEERRANGVE